MANPLLDPSNPHLALLRSGTCRRAVCHWGWKRTMATASFISCLCFSPLLAQFPGFPGDGDYDFNGAIDGGDLANLNQCLTGPAAGLPLLDCVLFDFDESGAIDLFDLKGILEIAGQLLPKPTLYMKIDGIEVRCTCAEWAQRVQETSAILDQCKIDLVDKQIVPLDDDEATIALDELDEEDNPRLYKQNRLDLGFKVPGSQWDSCVEEDKLEEHIDDNPDSNVTAFIVPDLRALRAPSGKSFAEMQNHPPWLGGPNKCWDGTSPKAAILLSVANHSADVAQFWAHEIGHTLALCHPLLWQSKGKKCPFRKHPPTAKAGNLMAGGDEITGLQCWLARRWGEHHGLLSQNP